MKRHNNLIFIVFSVIVMIFQSPISKSSLPRAITSLVKNYDEIFTFVLAIFIILRFLRIGIPKDYIKELVLFFVFLIVGIFGTLINNLQPLNAVVEDFVNCSKFFIAFFGVAILLKTPSSRNILNTLQKISSYLVILLFVLTLIDLALPKLLFVNDYTRYGIHAVHLFYYHPAVLSQVMALFLSIISVDSTCLKHINIYKIMCLLVMASTLRSKSFGFICLYIFFWLNNKTNVKPVRILLVILAILMIEFVSF